MWDQKSKPDTMTHGRDCLAVFGSTFISPSRDSVTEGRMLHSLCYTIVTGGEDISVRESRAAPTTSRDGCRGEVQGVEFMDDGL